MLTLESDGTFARERIYLGKSASPVKDAGSFSWNTAGAVITLDTGPDASRQYRVEENRLVQLDRAGKQITGALARMYVLEQTKPDSRIEDQRWLLTEVTGRPVETADMRKEAFILFDSVQHRVSGNASCNHFFGSYALLAGNRIRILGSMGATRMACPDMRLEAAFLEVLQTVDNYALDGDRLTFSRARMAPLLVFRRASDVN
jgi:heat shock protein HslJ